MVTGGTAGIGLAIATRFAEEGGIVHVCSRDDENVKNTVEALGKRGLKVHGHVCDIGDKEARA